MQKKVTRIGKGRGGRAKKVFTQIYSLGVFELFLMTGINKLKFIFCANWGKCGFCRSKNAKIQTSLFIRSFLKFSLISGIEKEGNFFFFFKFFKATLDYAQWTPFWNVLGTKTKCSKFVALLLVFSDSFNVRAGAPSFCCTCHIFRYGVSSEALASVLSKLFDLNPTLFIKCFFPNLYVQVCVYFYTRLNSDQSLARVRNWW